MQAVELPLQGEHWPPEQTGADAGHVLSSWQPIIMSGQVIVHAPASPPSPIPPSGEHEEDRVHTGSKS
jgi:hypothetical protein